MVDKISIKVSIEAIRERSFSLISDDLMPEGDFGSEIKVNHRLVTEIDQSNQLISVESGVQYSVADSVLCELILVTDFRIEPYRDVVEVDEQSRTITFSAEFVPTLLDIAYGCLRGVLYEKTKDSPISQYPLQIAPSEELAQLNRYMIK